MSRINVVVLTNDYKLKMSISDILKPEPGIDADTLCHNIEMAQGRFIINTPNVLVLDTDHFKLEHRFLKALTEKYLLYIILIGRRVTIDDSSMQFVMKPIGTSAETLNATAKIILHKIKSMSLSAPSFGMRDLASYVDTRHKLIAIAASTGGTEALTSVLTRLTKDIAPIVIVQHMPSMFTQQFASRLDKMSMISVKEAANIDLLRKGCAYIAPGDMHMRLVIKQQHLAVECFFGEKVNGVRPAADLLFESVARISGANAIGVILTGMGNDGARGLVEMHSKGAVTIGQDKETSVVYGMPKAAYDLGAVDFQMPLDDISEKLMELCR